MRVRGTRKSFDHYIWCTENYLLSFIGEYLEESESFRIIYVICVSTFHLTQAQGIQNRLDHNNSPYLANKYLVTII